MKNFISKSERKRQSKGIEKLVIELVTLAGKDLANLPCSESIKEDILKIKRLKSGARKRQIKYIAKMLRQSPDVSRELLIFLEDKRGSKLKKDVQFHELERMRDAIINETLILHDKAVENNYRASLAELLTDQGYAGSVLEVVTRFPKMDKKELQKAAWKFAETRNIVYSREIFRMTRNIVYSREIFRMLKAGMERQEILDDD